MGLHMIYFSLAGEVWNPANFLSRQHLHRPHDHVCDVITQVSSDLCRPELEKSHIRACPTQGK